MGQLERGTLVRFNHERDGEMSKAQRFTLGWIVLCLAFNILLTWHARAGEASSEGHCFNGAPNDDFCPPDEWHLIWPAISGYSQGTYHSAQDCRADLRQWIGNAPINSPGHYGYCDSVYLPGHYPEPWLNK